MTALAEPWLQDVATVVASLDTDTESGLTSVIDLSDENGLPVGSVERQHHTRGCSPVAPPRQIQIPLMATSISSASKTTC